jgi:hypothetical protein
MLVRQSASAGADASMPVYDVMRSRREGVPAMMDARQPASPQPRSRIDSLSPCGEGVAGEGVSRGRR